jgi:hypothetical protein
MYKYLFRFLSVLLFVILICGTAQATNLELTVLDSLDNTPISHATVFVDSVNLGRTTTNGQFSIPRLVAKDINLRISLTGYDDWSDVVLSNVTSLTVNLSRKSLALTATMYDADTLRPIPGADIRLTADNVTQMKKTDNAGTATFNVRGSTLYAIEITSPNYQSRTGTIEISSTNADVQYWLLSGNRFSFVVKDQSGSTPIPDAEVRIDTILSGKTDLKGVLTTQVGRGKTYTFDITKEGYLPYSTTRTISDTDALLNVLMSKSPVGAVLYVIDESQAPVAGAEVYVDGTLAGTTNQFGGYTLSRIVFGNYTVEVKKDGFVATKKQIDVIKPGNEFTIELPFEEVDLTIYVQDKEQKVVPGVTISFNSNTIGLTDTHGQVVSKVKYNTLYNITAVKEGYQPVSVQKEVKQGTETPTLSITLEKNLDWGFIGLVVASALGVLAVFAVIRMGRSRKRHHIIRRNEI